MDDYRQSDEYCQYYKEKGWINEKIGSTNVLIKKIPLLGTVVKIQRGSINTSLDEIDKIAKKHKALLTAIEPDITTDDAYYNQYEKLLEKYGYINLNMFFSPTKTEFIDISKSEEDILAGFDADIRGELKKNLATNIEYKTIDGLEDFYKLLRETAFRRKYFLQNFSNWKKQWEPFKDNIRIILAYGEGKILGGNMFIIKPSVAYGLFVPTTQTGRDRHLTASLIWEGFKQAKKNGCVLFDLNGLYDARYSSPKKWLGLSAFKKKFKGREVEYMHPKVKVYSRYLKPFERFGLLWMFFVES